MGNNVENSISTKSLLTQYSWYKETFLPIIQSASDDFFEANFKLDFFGLSKNINCLLDDESCFVTKVQIEKDYDMFFRITDKAIEIILDKTLGKGKGKFGINKISELEAKVITSFNAFMYKALKPKLRQLNPTELKRKNFDVINMTFFLKDIEENNKSYGKVIVTLPDILVEPEQISCEEEVFSNDDFFESKIQPIVRVGSTSFKLYEMMNFEVDDVVVLENSDLNKFKLLILDEEFDINIDPNMDLLIEQDTDSEEGDNNMAEGHNLWDSLEVDMYAEFDSVKMTLGELKKIQEGLVIDVSSLYNNNITLRVENKAIASGSLVVVNDRYGVKINKLFAKGTPVSSVSQVNNEQEQNYENFEDNSVSDNDFGQEDYQEEAQSSPAAGGGEEEFDYSDFDLEDEGI